MKIDDTVTTKMMIKNENVLYITADDEGFTPFMLAAQRGHTKVMDLLRTVPMVGRKHVSLLPLRWQKSIERRPAYNNKRKKYIFPIYGDTSTSLHHSVS